MVEIDKTVRVRGVLSQAICVHFLSFAPLLRMTSVQTLRVIQQNEAEAEATS